MSHILSGCACSGGYSDESNSARKSLLLPSIAIHSVGNLRMFLGPEDENNLLHSELARFDFTPLEDKATAMREVLIEKGWRDLAPSDGRP